MNPEQETHDALSALQNQIRYVVSELAKSNTQPQGRDRAALAAQLVSMLEARKRLEAGEHQAG